MIAPKYSCAFARVGHLRTFLAGHLPADELDRFAEGVSPSVIAIIIRIRMKICTFERLYRGFLANTIAPAFLFVMHTRGEKTKKFIPDVSICMCMIRLTDCSVTRSKSKVLEGLVDGVGQISTYFKVGE